MSTTLKTRKIAPLLAVAVAALACAGAALADPLLDGSTYASLVGSNAGTVNGVSFSAGGNFATTSDNGWVGVTGGGSDNEMNLGQSIARSFTAVTVGADGSSPGAAWAGFGSLSNLSAPTGNGGGAWLVSRNPFGDLAASKLASTAVSSNRCQAAGSCNNQSDDVGTAVDAMAEPETYALLAACLGAIGFIARRRRRH